MQLDVSAPAASRRGARSIRTQIVPSALRGRAVVDDCAGRIRQTDVELVVDPGFSCVFGANGKINVRECRVVGPGGATDFPGTGRLARLRIRTGAIIDELIFRDTGPVNVQACAMVDVLQVAPGWRTVLASAPDAEVRLGTVVYDPSAAGQKVTRRRRPSLYARRGRSPNHHHRASHDERH